jgi:multidrug efflux pump subunit AcrA (membrane-fusion protein)
MFAKVRMPFGKPRPVPEITEEAVVHKRFPFGFVWVVNDHDILEQRQVKVGQSDHGMCMITEGLGPNDWVITSIPKDLHEGDKVERRRPPSPTQKQQQKP